MLKFGFFNIYVLSLLFEDKNIHFLIIILIINNLEYFF